jgi:hypothetical protein
MGKANGDESGGKSGDKLIIYVEVDVGADVGLYVLV